MCTCGRFLWCRSEAAATEFTSSGALAGKGKGWILEPCTVSESGESSSCGGQLQVRCITHLRGRWRKILTICHFTGRGNSSSLICKVKAKATGTNM